MLISTATPPTNHVHLGKWSLVRKKHSVHALPNDISASGSRAVRGIRLTTTDTHSTTITTPSATVANVAPVMYEVLRVPVPGASGLALGDGYFSGIIPDDSLTSEQFTAVDMRVGRIVSVEGFPEARVPAWKLRIDFGPELGVKLSSARIANYSTEELEGTLVVAVVNFPPKQIGPVRSEVLVLGAVDEDGTIRLLRPDGEPALGSRIA
jgi:tRNA-binding protein